MRRVIGLQDLNDCIIPGDPKARAHGGGIGRFVTQHFQQSANPVVAVGRSDQHRDNQPLLQVLLQIVENFVPWGSDVGEQFLHQLLVIVGKLFQHLIAGFAFPYFRLIIHIDQLRCSVLPVNVGTFQREIDEAADDTVFPDRNLTQYQRLRRHFLQDRERFAQ